TFVSCDKKAETTANNTSTDSIVANEEPMVDTEHTSQNSLDWNGTYEGVLPCADCEGIKTNIVLNNDGTFKYNTEYINKNTKTADEGTIMWHDNGSVVHLKGKDTDVKLKVVENALIYLDQEGNEIEGPLKEHYRLNKVIQ
ncbi:MAG TPA: copper resistance protein NlpE, partial [Flavobacterium sp.]|nr:copper resistance protein NlpE [Flavobacterium sp.]